MERKRRPNKPLTPEQKKAKSARDMEYNKKMIIKRIVDFNRGSEEDMKILGHLDSRPNKARYVKGLIREDMDKTGG